MKIDVYGIREFQRDFPDDDACLDYIFKKRYPELKGYYRIKTRKAYVNKAGHQIYPLSGTIFEKSSTPLWKWFFAIFLFSASKNGVSGKELERQLKITYKTGWRIAKQIRSAMKQNNMDQLFGTVEADETYLGYKDAILELFKQKPEAALGIDDVMRYISTKYDFSPNRETVSLRVGYLVDNALKLERVVGKRGFYRLISQKIETPSLEGVSP